MGPPKSTMKLFRFGNLNNEKTGIIDQDNDFRDLSSIITDLNPNSINHSTVKKIKELDLKKLPKIEKNIRIGACISNPQKFIGIGLNYIDHAEETGMKPPAEPIIFFKANSCISGPHDNVLIPKIQKKLIGKLRLLL